MPKKQYITANGAVLIKTELEHLTGTERLALAKRLHDAIQMGDLSENADYHKAKEDQAFLEGRIQELEYILRNAVIVEDSDAPRDMVNIGARVTVQEDDQEPEVFHMVGAKEADPRNGKISHESPIGQALMDHRIGDTVVVETPGGRIHLKILGIA
jgi:transcription elongation factor GreA